jgi:hypothetical protein
MLAAEKARRLAREGYRTLLVCFNQRLATTFGRELADVPASGGLVNSPAMTRVRIHARRCSSLDIVIVSLIGGD